MDVALKFRFPVSDIPGRTHVKSVKSIPIGNA